MDSDIEQLGQIVSAIMLAGVGVFLLLQALRSRRRKPSPPVNDGDVEAAPIDRSTTA
jgi:ABC-type nickel/cobalt efflux system permease component RcnA